MEEKGGTMTFDGSAASIDDVSAFMAALKTSRYFTGVELRKTAAVTKSAFRIVDFTITAAVNYVPVAVAAAPKPAPPGAPR